MNVASTSMSAAPASLTPQRKHRKLLKGTSEPVWSPSAEAVFIDGLRQYLDSPWAVHSRGRSRFRNSYMVEHLSKAGITRSKKQVASHIQVLRNMWKGQPEYHLVAGGDEVYNPDSSPTSPIKSEELDSPSSLITFDFSDEAETMSSNSSPSFSPHDLTSDIPPSPAKNMAFKLEPYSSPSTRLNFGNDLSRAAVNGLYASPPTTGPLSAPLTGAVSPSYSKHLHSRTSHFPGPKMGPYSPPVSVANRVTLLTLRADGMMPFGVTLDALLPPGAASACLLKIRLAVPSIDDTRSPATLHGFSSNVAFASVWSASAKCSTRVYQNGICVSAEMSGVEATNIETGIVHAILPESSLSRCRWLDAVPQTTIHQEIVVDNETLLYVIYHLDRRINTGMPSAELVGYQPYRMEKSTSQSPSLSPAPRSTLHSSHISQYARPSSLSTALTPVTAMQFGQARP